MMIELHQVALTYQSPEGEIQALKEVSLAVEQGEFVAIVGPSGCGKSTLLSLVAGLERPTEGAVLVEGCPVAAPSPAVGLMPQRDQLFPWRTIWDNVVLGLEISGQNTPRRRQEVQQLLERYGLAQFARQRPHQLSGGMRQRCALIRTLATRPRTLLLDEPFSALDYQTRLAVSADIQAIIRQEGKTALLVTHDIGEAIALSDRVVVLSRRPGRVKGVYPLDDLAHLAPLERREHPRFNHYFNLIWKELDIHG